MGAICASVFVFTTQGTVAYTKTDLSGLDRLEQVDSGRIVSSDRRSLTKLSEAVRAEAGRRVIGIHMAGGFTLASASKGQRLSLHNDKRGRLKFTTLLNAPFAAVQPAAVAPESAEASSLSAQMMNVSFDKEHPVIISGVGFSHATLRVALAFDSNEKGLASPISQDTTNPEVAALMDEEAGDPRAAMSYSPAKPAHKGQGAFSAILNEGKKEVKGFVPPVGDEDFKWARNILPDEAFGKKQQECLAKAIYFEARGEPVRGQAAVAQVILNRVRNPAFPETICGVVYQNKQLKNRCQFSFACDGIEDKIGAKNLFNVAEQIAKATTSGKIWLSKVGTSTHYHADFVHPRWASVLNRVEKIGAHIFYRTNNGGWG